MKKKILIFTVALGTLSLTAYGFLNWSEATNLEVASCQPSCQTACQPTCQSSSQPTCKSACQPICQPAKESSCQTTSQATCKAISESTCQPSYQPAQSCGGIAQIWPEPEANYFYDVDSRFTKMTKETIQELKSIVDIFPHDDASPISSFGTVRVYPNHENRDICEIGDTPFFTEAQLDILRTAEYSTTVLITATCTRTKPYSDEMESDSLVCFRTIVPEQEAIFAGGQAALLSYLRLNSNDKVSIIDEDPKRGKVSFTVTSEGAISNIQVDASSGYPTLDKDFVEMLANMPNWSPAISASGIKIDQEFVFFFGPPGC